MHADRDQSAHAVEKSELQNVEADESHDRRRDEPHGAGALTAGMHRRRLQCRVMILLRKIGVERLRRRVQEIAGKAQDRSIGDYVLVHGVLAPARTTPVEEPHVPVGVPLAMRKPATEKTVAPRKRVGGLT